MQVQNISNNNQNTTFGVRYTKNSIKTLKKLLPDLSISDEFEFSKEALENLIKAKKRNDNLIVNVYEDDLGLGIVGFEVRHLSGKSKVFKRPIIGAPGKSDSSRDFRSCAERFLDDAKYVNSPEFVNEANRILMLHYLRQGKLPLWKKMKESFLRATGLDERLPEIIEDITMAWISLLDSAHAIIVLKPDASSKELRGFALLKDFIKEKFNPTKPLPTAFQAMIKRNQEELSNLIDKLVD